MGKKEQDRRAVTIWCYISSLADHGTPVKGIKGCWGQGKREGRVKKKEKGKVRNGK